MQARLILAFRFVARTAPTNYYFVSVMSQWQQEFSVTNGGLARLNVIFFRTVLNSLLNTVNVTDSKLIWGNHKHMWHKMLKSDKFELGIYL